MSCQYGCSSKDIEDLQTYICTDFSTSEDWQYGGGSFHYVFPVNDNDIVTIGSTVGSWIKPFGKANVSTTFSLTTRNDTGQINSSPRVVTTPVLRLQEGRDHIIRLAVTDPDNDIIQCRWAVGEECEGVCDGIPGAELNSSTCTITYTANRGTGYKAVALMIEDFMPGSTRPMSMVALQFLVLVGASGDPNSLPPEFIDPTLPQGSCVSVAAGETFTTQLVATSHSSSVSITEIQTLSPIGANRGTLQHIQGTNISYVNSTWSPTTSQLNQVHLFCYTAVDSAGLASEQICIQLLAGYLPPVPQPGSAIPNHQMVYPSNATLIINFDKDIQRPSETAYIIIYEFVSEAEVYRIDASSSSEVTFSNSTEITLKPNFVFTEKTIYYIVLNEGIVQGTQGCGLKNVAVTNKTFWNFEVMDISPPVITFIENPTESDVSSGITIEWESNENVTWECYLITVNTVLSVNCSNASWSGYNLERGNYTLNINATDAAGNKAFSSHTFFLTST